MDFRGLFLRYVDIYLPTVAADAAPLLFDRRFSPSQRKDAPCHGKVSDRVCRSSAMMGGISIKSLCCYGARIRKTKTLSINMHAARTDILRKMEAVVGTTGKRHWEALWDMRSLRGHREKVPNRQVLKPEALPQLARPRAHHTSGMTSAHCARLQRVKVAMQQESRLTGGSCARRTLSMGSLRILVRELPYPATETPRYHRRR